MEVPPTTAEKWRIKRFLVKQKMNKFITSVPILKGNSSDRSDVVQKTRNYTKISEKKIKFKVKKIT